MIFTKALINKTPPDSVAGIVPRHIVAKEYFLQV